MRNAADTACETTDCAPLLVSHALNQVKPVMNVLARKYKPAPTANGTVRPTSSGSFRRSTEPQQSPLGLSGRAGSGRLTSPQQQPVDAPKGFDYEAEVRRLCGQGAPLASRGVAREEEPTSSGAAGPFDQRVAPRGYHSPSRFRWVQQEDVDTLPPKDRPQLDLSAASKARNQMYRPVAAPAPSIDASSESWRRLTPAQRAAQILGKA
jgi:hypothetical protein